MHSGKSSFERQSSKSLIPKIKDQVEKIILSNDEKNIKFCLYLLDRLEEKVKSSCKNLKAKIYDNLRKVNELEEVDEDQSETTHFTDLKNFAKDFALSNLPKKLISLISTDKDEEETDQVKLFEKLLQSNKGNSLLKPIFIDKENFEPIKKQFYFSNYSIKDLLANSKPKGEKRKKLEKLILRLQSKKINNFLERVATFSNETEKAIAILRSIILRKSIGSLAQGKDEDPFMSLNPCKFLFKVDRTNALQKLIEQLSQFPELYNNGKGLIKDLNIFSKELLDYNRKLDLYSSVREKMMEQKIEKMQDMAEKNL